MTYPSYALETLTDDQWMYWINGHIFTDPLGRTFSTWAVNDYFGSDYSFFESSGGKVTSDRCRVQLPDGWVQIVNYKADFYGYTTDFKHEGTPKYP
jgi:hypothetical protein